MMGLKTPYSPALGFGTHCIKQKIYSGIQTRLQEFRGGGLNIILAIFEIYRMFKKPEAEFKEFEPRLKFKLRFKYGWFP